MKRIRLLMLIVKSSSKSFIWHAPKYFFFFLLQNIGHVVPSRWRRKVSFSSSSLQLLQKSMARSPRAMRLACVPIMQFPNLSNNLTEHLSRLIVGPSSSLSQIFRVILPASAIPAAYLPLIALSFINLLVFIGINGVESSMIVVPLLASWLDLQLFGYHIIRTSYLSTTSL